MEWKAINKEGRHVGLDFYDLLIEGRYTHDSANDCKGDFLLPRCVTSTVLLELFDHIF
jgi:hypothetical protein